MLVITIKRNCVCADTNVSVFFKLHTYIALRLLFGTPSLTVQVLALNTKVQTMMSPCLTAFLSVVTDVILVMVVCCN